MKSKLIATLIILFFIAGESFSQEIFKHTINKYNISFSKNKDQQFILSIKQKNKIIYQKSSKLLRINFYNIDDDPEDEMMMVESRVQNTDTLNSLHIFTFQPQFALCDSLFIEKYFPEFYQFDFEGHYYIKIYDYEVKKYFPSRRTELPFSFYYLNDCLLEYDNFNSFEEFESEINYLIDEIKDLRRSFDCTNQDDKNDMQRLFVCLYLNIKNADMTFDFENFLRKNYPCDDREEFLIKIKTLFY